MIPAILLLLLSAEPPPTVIRIAVPQQEPPLERGAFAAKLDGLEAKVLRVQGPEDDLVLLLVMDVSGDATLVDTARDALVEQTGKLAKNQWVGLLRSQDSLKALVDPTADREKISQAIKDYAATGKAGLLDSVESVASIGQRILQKSGARVAVVYVTDSNIANYREDYTNPVINASDARDLSRKFPDQLVREKIQKISDQLARFETPIFVVQLSFFADPINEAYQRGLAQLAEESGGLGVFCRSRGEIPEAVDRVMMAAARHWSVAVELKSGKRRTVTVDVLNGDRDIPNRARFALGK
ncbi:MAG: hypothetical protein FJW36_08000 [Acidobacteria bacterium]|nr:hypothetical protein [Acidobacteriota bacterium]